MALVGKAFGLGGLTGVAIKKSMDKKPKAQTPSAPTIDDAAQREQEADRVRRRRGVLANIFGGGSGAGPTVAKTTLGG